MKLKTVKEASVKNKRVLVRVDYNVSLDNNHNVTDNTRITQTLPTLKFLLKNAAKIILVSHLGRPKDKNEKKYSLTNIANILGSYLDKKVELVKNINNIPNARIVMLENIRFFPGEKANDAELARQLAQLADIYVNDAFGTAHRAHASVVGIAEYLPAYAGLLLLKEIRLITTALNSSEGSLTIVIGGAKTPEKIRAIGTLLDKANNILVGGAIANTFLSTWGIPTGASLVDYEMSEMARQVIWMATQSNAALILPDDVVVSNEDRSRKASTLSYRSVPGHLAIFDIGPKARQKYKKKIINSDRVIWNGPMGLFEDKRYATGTSSILQAMTKNSGTTIIGGGDTLTAIKDKSIIGKITHVSTGGGALLEFLEKGTLPGIEIVKCNG